MLYFQPFHKINEWHNNYINYVQYVHLFHVLLLLVIDPLQIILLLLYKHYKGLNYKVWHIHSFFHHGGIISQKFLFFICLNCIEKNFLVSCSSPVEKENERREYYVLSRSEEYKLGRAHMLPLVSRQLDTDPIKMDDSDAHALLYYIGVGALLNIHASIALIFFSSKRFILDNY
ncbi:hypothetical protein ACJX0J_038268 [Zea mays]